MPGDEYVGSSTVEHNVVIEQNVAGKDHHLPGLPRSANDPEFRFRTRGISIIGGATPKFLGGPNL